MSQKRVVNPWQIFDCNEPENRILDIIGNKFIKEIRTIKIIDDKNLAQKNTIVSCVDCFGFQLFLISLEENSMLDTLNCRFVTSDCFTYGDDYSDDIFTGNSQFVYESYFYSREQKELLFRDGDVKLSKQPLHKSCFTSLQKKTLSVFLHNLQKSL